MQKMDLTRPLLLFTTLVNLISFVDGQDFVEYPLKLESIDPTPPQACSCVCNFNKKKEAKCTWTMAFKAVKGNGRNVLNDFLSGGDMNMDLPEANTISSIFPYRNSDVLDNWYKLFIEQVKVEVYQNSVRKTWFVFDGAGSTIDDWMDEDRLVSSPYTVLTTGSFNYFSIQGHGDRSFFINRSYNGCGDDCGFFAVVDGKAGSDYYCPWEELESQPYFIYSKLWNSCAAYQTDGDDCEVGIGNRFVIYVKHCKN